MSDYIKRDSFIEDTVRKYCDDCDRRKNANGKTVYALGDAPCRACSIKDVVDDIEDYPAADVRENVRGDWIRYSVLWTCSECGKDIRTITDGIDNFDEDPVFCPYCGAQMEGEQR